MFSRLRVSVASYVRLGGGVGSRRLVPSSNYTHTRRLPVSYRYYKGSPDSHAMIAYVHIQGTRASTWDNLGEGCARSSLFGVSTLLFGWGGVTVGQRPGCNSRCDLLLQPTLTLVCFMSFGTLFIPFIAATHSSMSSCSHLPFLASISIYTQHSEAQQRGYDYTR